MNKTVSTRLDNSAGMQQRVMLMGRAQHMRLVGENMLITVMLVLLEGTEHAVEHMLICSWVVLTCTSHAKAKSFDIALLEFHLPCN